MLKNDTESGWEEAASQLGSVLSFLTISLS